MRNWSTALMFLALAGLIGFLAFGTGSETFFNDTGLEVYGLRVSFDQPVTIVRLGEGFANWTSEESGTTILFTGGAVAIWGNFYFFWEPEEARILTYEWVLSDQGGLGAASKCDSLDLSDDLVTGFSVVTVHPINQKEYGCLVVSGDDGFPVLAGKQSFRIEVRPGDCSASSGWDDCPNDRSRHEIKEREDTCNGETSIYEANYYVPIQPKFKPRGDNIMFLGQLNTEDEGYHGTLVYLEVDNDQNLLLRTHKGFSWDIDKQVVVASNIFERWINLRYEVYASTDSTGYFRVYIDDKLVLSESRPTIPSENGYLELRVGIYNSFISEADEAFENQVIFVDQMKKY